MGLMRHIKKDFYTLQALVILVRLGLEVPVFCELLNSCGLALLGPLVCSW